MKGQIDFSLMENKNVFLILDGGTKVSPQKILYTYTPNALWKPLYFKTKYVSLLHVSPILVQTTIDSDLFKWYLGQGYKDSGIIAVSEHEFQTLFEHLQNIITIKMESNKELFFRFYDPNVLIYIDSIFSTNDKIHLLGSITYLFYYSFKDEIFNTISGAKDFIKFNAKTIPLFKNSYLLELKK